MKKDLQKETFDVNNFLWKGGNTMKKLFLTSGLAIMLVGSAFAQAHDINNDQTHTLAGTGDPTANPPVAADTASCQEPTLGLFSGDQTFYAKWTANPYHILYAAGTARNLQGDTTQVHTPVTPQNAVTSQNVSFDGESPAILGNMFTTPAGYQFAGWKGNYNLSGQQTAYTDATQSGGTNYTVDQVIDPYKVVGDLTLTALWTPKNYTVTYDKGAHSASGVEDYVDTNGAQMDKNYTAKTGGGANAAASSTGIYAAPGYTFRGFSKSSSSEWSSSGQNSWVWSGESPYTLADDLTVYAIYSANPYTITYYPGVAKTALYSHNVSGTETTQNVTFDAGVTTKNNNSTDLTGGAWSQTGYTFAGWRSDHDLLTNATSSALANDNTEGGYVYGAGVSNINATPLTYKVPGNTKMYAIWAPNKSGIITLDSSVYPSNNFNDTAKYTTSTGVTATSPATVVSLYETGLWPSTVEQMTAANKIQSFSIPSKTGYTFNGFYEPDGTTQVISNTGAIVNDNALRSVPTEGDSTKVWHAKWTANKRTITYYCGAQPGSQPLTCSASGTNPNCTATAPSSVEITYDTTYNLPDNAGTCEYKGWTFSGWACDYELTTGNGVSSNNNENYAYAESATGTFQVDNNVKCYATWTANTIGLEWDKGVGATGGTGGGTQCTYEGGITIPSAPSKDGYSFQGWTTNPNPGSNAGYVVFPTPANP